MKWRMFATFKHFFNCFPSLNTNYYDFNFGLLRSTKQPLVSFSFFLSFSGRHSNSILFTNVEKELLVILWICLILGSFNWWESCLFWLDWRRFERKWIFFSSRRWNNLTRMRHSISTYDLFQIEDIAFYSIRIKVKTFA